jgi:hypothetical protein
VLLAADGRTGRKTVNAQTAIRRAGYKDMSRFAHEAGGALPNYLGRVMNKMFLSTVVAEGMREFEGIIVAFDPTDIVRQFHVIFDDGDQDWLPLSGMEPLLLTSPVKAADLLLLDSLADAALQHKAH